MSRVESPLGPFLLGLSTLVSLSYGILYFCAQGVVSSVCQQWRSWYLSVMDPGTLPTKSLSDRMTLSPGIPLKLQTMQPSLPEHLKLFENFWSANAGGARNMNLLPAGLTGPFGTQPVGDRGGGHHGFNYPRGISRSLKHLLYTLAVF